MTRSIDPEALARPISAEQPSGPYLIYEPLYRELERARAAEGDGPGGRAEPDWNKAIRLGLEALATSTKDLQVAAQVVEALGRRDGLDGLRQGFEMLRLLQETFWESVHPAIEDGDLEPRLAPFDFLEQALPQVLHVAIPLTGGRAGAEAYSLQRFHRARTESEVEAREEAIRQTDPAFHRDLAGSLAACREAFDGWAASLAGLAGPKAPGLGRIRNLLDELQRALVTVGLVRPFPPPAPPRAEGPAAEAGPPVAAPAEAGGPTPPEAPEAAEPGPPAAPAGPGRPIEAEARALAAAGREGAAVELLDRARRSARSPRERFLLQLEMVETLVRTRHVKVARPMLDELVGVLEERRLDSWEDPALVARLLEAWLDCLRESGSDDDREAARPVFERLCRLEPQRALRHETGR